MPFVIGHPGRIAHSPVVEVGGQEAVNMVYIFLKGLEFDSLQNGVPKRVGNNLLYYLVTVFRASVSDSKCRYAGRRLLRFRVGISFFF